MQVSLGNLEEKHLFRQSVAAAAEEEREVVVVRERERAAVKFMSPHYVVEGVLFRITN